MSNTSHQLVLGDYVYHTWDTISPCGRYRYLLGERWASGPLALWCCLNPSTATKDKEDATKRKIRGFTRRWVNAGGLWLYAGWELVNMFAWRGRDPLSLRAAEDPVGPENDHHIATALCRAGVVIAAWGNTKVPTPEAFDRRRAAIGRLFRPRPVYCLGTTGDSEPRHPLMLAYSTPPEVFWEDDA